MPRKKKEPGQNVVSAKKSAKSRIGTIREQAKARWKDGLFDGAADFRNKDRGVSLEGALPLQYLWGIDVIPMDRLLGVVGKERSNKTSLIWELGRRIIDKGGIFVYLDTEKKANSEQCLAILRHEHYMENVFIPTVRSLEDLWEKIISFCKTCIEVGGAEGPPVMFAWDSLNATLFNRTKEAIDRGKTAGYSDAQAAAYIKDQVKFLTYELMGKTPVSLMVINHQTTDLAEAQTSGMTTSRGDPYSHEPGGRMIQYITSNKLMLKAAGYQKRMNVRHMTVKMSIGKTSMGADKDKPILVPVISGKTPLEDGSQGPLQYEFDWDTALVDLLLKLPKTLVQQVLNITKASSGDKVSCDEMGLKGISSRELGQAIHADPEMTKQLQDFVLDVSHWNKCISYDPPQLTSVAEPETETPETETSETGTSEE